MRLSLTFLLLLTLLVSGAAHAAAPAASPKASPTARPAAPDAAGSVTLNQTLRNAFAYSPALQQAQEVRQQAVHEVRRAQAGFYPTIGIWGGVGATQSDDIATRATKEERDVVGTGSVGFQLSQPLWQGGATSASVRSRQSSLETRTWEVMDSATTLAYGAVSAHADVLRRRTLYSLAVANVAEHEKIFKLLQLRFDKGLSSQGDLDQVRSRLARAEATRTMHRTGLDTALANYMRLTGQAVPARLQPVPLPTQTFASETTVRDASVQFNPRILANLANIRMTLGEKDFARSRFSPNMSLDAGPAYNDWGRKGKNYQWTWNAMLNLRWDIYSGGADEAGFQAAAAKVREARKALHHSMDLLDEEIRVTFARTRDARVQAEYYGKAKLASRSARINFFTQYEAGQKDLLNVLDAESEYFYAAESECINATDAVLGHYRLLALAGELLEVTGMDTADLKTPPTASRESWGQDFFKPSTPDGSEGKDSTLRRLGQ